MEILLNLTSKEKNGREIAKTAKIENYVALNTSSTLLLISEDTFAIDGKSETWPMLNIRKVQFLASVTTDLNISGIGAFYIDEYSELSCYLLNGLPNGYSQDVFYKLVDYNSYLDTCKLTGEKMLPIGEYYFKSLGGSLDLNSLVLVDGKFLNTDQQNDFFI